MRRMDDYFNGWADGELCKTKLGRSNTRVFVCKKCGALCTQEDRDKHVTEHKTNEDLLALAHQLSDTVASLHRALSRLTHI